jgi:mRNA-degrading endonuclease RelE of RelBE toxin-antitoxin system
MSYDLLWSERFFKQLKHIYEQYRNEWVSADLLEVSTLLHNYELNKPIETELKPKEIDGNYHWCVIDGLIYRLRNDDYEELLRLHGNCCATCDEDTLADLRNGIEKIKAKTLPHSRYWENFSTPKVEADDTETLPF